MKKIIMTMALILIFAGLVRGEGVSVSDLYEHCKQPAPKPICIGFVSGAVQMHTALNIIVKTKTKGELSLGCVDKDLKVDGIIQWMLDHEKTVMKKSRDYSAVALILTILDEFRCK